MKVFETKIPDVKIIEPTVHEDERGFFVESWHRRRFADHGMIMEFVQDNHSRSVKGTVRGLHYQVRQPQGKLVRVTVGEVFDVVVDIRRNSPTFGHWLGEYLSAGNKRTLWVPPCLAHGFCVTSEVAELQYKCTEYYAPDDDCSILWNDPTLAIEWPVEEHESVVSAKDSEGTLFSDAEYFD